MIFTNCNREIFVICIMIAILHNILSYSICIIKVIIFQNRIICDQAIIVFQKCVHKLLSNWGRVTVPKHYERMSKQYE